MTDGWRPEWRRSELYPGSMGEPVSDEQWAWEFLRRNAAYIMAWEDHKLTGETRPWPEVTKRFGVRKICAPYTAWSIDLEIDLCYEQFAEHSIVSWTDRPHVDAWGNQRGLSNDDFLVSTQPQGADEVVVKFNLRHDLKNQFLAAKMLLELQRDLLQTPYMMRKRKEGGLGEPVESLAAAHFSIERKRRDMYPLYLRLLDAECQETGLSTNELLDKLAPILVPDTKNEYPDYSARKTLAGNLKQAYLMRDFGYRTLVVEQNLNQFKAKDPDDKRRRSKKP